MQLSREKMSGKWDCFIVSKNIMIYVESSFSCIESIFNSMNTIRILKAKNLWNQLLSYFQEFSSLKKLKFFNHHKNV
jgi:hypothetical protein